ncbi:hypothetical protein ACFY00_02655 [Kitasatospora sp. NPDC001540]|uniref:hypothetical protein n=1 Tax=Kitasatospora sp. NPDC001540 TaxID=3364014 RepID=UPI0036B2DB0B
MILPRRELATDFVPQERYGRRQPVLLIDHAGPAASLEELFAAFERGEAGIAVLNAQERTGPWIGGPVPGVGFRA